MFTEERKLLHCRLRAQTDFWDDKLTEKQG